MIKNDLTFLKIFKALAIVFAIGWIFSFNQAQAATTIGANISTDGYLKLNTSAVPPAVDGTIHYDGTKFRCYENGAWKDCIGGIAGTVLVNQGGTNITSYTAGDLLYATGATTLSKLPIGSINDILTVAGGVPTWSASTPLVITNTYVEGFIDSNPGNDCVTIAGAQIGDVCIVTGTSKSYICANATCTLNTDWKELLASASIYLQKANNLSDLTNFATARTNLGLGATDTPNFAGLDFTPGAPPAYSEGRLYYDSNLKSLSYYNDQPAVPVNIGQKNILRVENNSGGPISYGQIVYISGAGTGGIPAVDLARADSSSTSKVLGFAAQNIASGSQGYITAYGMLTGIDTSGPYSAGDPLYLSPGTAGAFTRTRPTQPNYEVPVGYVGDAAASGTILAFVVPKLSTSVTTGGVPFGNAAGYLIDDSANLFWDNTTKQLGIGTNTPAYTLDVRGDIKTGDGSIFYLGTNVGAPAGVPANGAMYYDTGTNKFRCYENSAWKDCDTTVGTVSLQMAYNGGAAITTAGGTDIAFNLTNIGEDFNVTGAGAVSLTPTGASSFTSGAALTLTGGATSTWGTSAGDLNLAVNGAGSGNVQIGTGVASATPDQLVLDLGSSAPASPTNGAMYYDTGTNKFRCYENTAWTDCISVSATPILSSITAATAANSINNGDNAQTWNWNLTTPNKIGFKFGENVASTGADSVILESSALSASTATPLRVINLGTAPSFVVENQLNDVRPSLYITPKDLTSDGHVAIGSNFFDPTAPEKLKVDSNGEDSYNIISAAGDLNNYLQINITNRNSGDNASSDLVAGSDNGNETDYYIDMGINSSGYSNSDYDIGGPNDSYLYAQGGPGPGGNLSIGTATAGTVLKFHTGGTTAADEQMRIDGSGNVGIGTTAVNAKLDLAPSTADALRIEPYGAVAGNTGGLEFMELVANGSNYVGFKAPDSIAANKIWTLPNADGTSGQMLATDGAGALSWASATGVWQRVGTTLSPTTAGDAVTSDGLLTGQLGLTVTGADVSLNDTSNFNTKINTGTSNGTVSIGNSASGAIGVTSGAALTLAGGATSSFSTTAGNINLQPAGTVAGAYVQIGAGGAGSATPAYLALDVKSTTGDPATGTNGAMYYNEFTDTFRCFINGSWSACDTTAGATTLQSAYNNGATINTSGTNIAFTLNTTDQFTASGTGSVNLTPTGASSFTSGGALTLTGGAGSTWSTSAGALTLTSAAAATWGTAAGNLNLAVNGAATGRVQIGTGAGVSTPDLLVLDIKSDVEGALAGTNGAMYYNTILNDFRCFASGGWQSCGATAATAVTLQQAYISGNVITLSDGDFTVKDSGGTNTLINASGAGAVALTPTGALTLTGGATSTWSVTGAGNDLTLDAADVMNLGTTNATGITIGKSGITTTNIGTLQTGNAATTGSFKIADGSTNFITLTSPSIASDYTLTLPTTAGSSGQAMTTNGSGTLSWSNVMADPMTTRGDIIIRDATNTTARLGKGTAGQVLKSDGTDIGYATLTPTDVGLSNVTNDAQIPKAIGTAKGDLIAYTASNTPVRLPVGGTSNYVLTVDPSQSTGMRWMVNMPNSNSLDFAQFSDAMTVDANTSINLAGKNLTINDLTGAGALSMTTNAAALTLTAGAASTWSTTAGALTINSGTTTPAGLNLGTAGTNVVTIGNAGSTFALTSSGGLNATTGGALTGVASIDTIGTSATALTFAGAGTVSSTDGSSLTLDSGTSGDVNLGTGGTAKNIKIGNATGATNVNVLAGSGNVTIGTSDATGTLLVLDTKTGAGDPGVGVNGGMYYNSSEGKFKCYENGAWKNCDSASAIGLQQAYNVGNTITTSGGNAITFITPNVPASNNAGLVIQQNNTTNNPVALQLTNAGTGNDITATNWSVTKNGNISTSGNITTTGSGFMTSAGLLTGQLGLTVTGAAVSLNSGITAASNFNTSINEGTSTGTVTIGNSLAGAISITSGSTITIGSAAATAVKIGKLTTNGVVITSGGDGTLSSSATLPVANGGTGLATTPTNGQLLIGNGTNYTLAGLTAGTGISITPGAGSISIAATSGLPAGTTNDSTLRYNTGTSTWQENTSFLVTSAGTASVAAGQSYTGAGAVTLSSAAATALTIDSGTTGNLLIGTDASAETINIATGGAVKVTTLGSTNTTSATIVQSGTGNIKLEIGGSAVTGNVQIGGTAGGTPDLLVLDTKNTAGDPTCTNGAVYYNSNLSKLRCCQNSIWLDCIHNPSVDSVNDTSITSPTPGTYPTAGTYIEILTPTNPTLTPRSTTSRILVTGAVKYSNPTGGEDTNAQIFIAIRRGSGSCAGTQVGTTLTSLISDPVQGHWIPFSFIDSPATTSAQAYTVCAALADSNGATATNATTPQVMLTIEEISAAGG